MSFRLMARRIFAPVVFLGRVIWWTILLIGFWCLRSLRYFRDRPFGVTRAVGRLLLESFVAALKGFWEIQRRFFRTRSHQDWWLFLRAVLIVLGSYYLFFSWVENKIEPLP